MKYLLIGSLAGCGSTGRIAAEKCRELMAQGHECVLAYGREMANCDDIQTVRIGTKLDYQLHGVINRLLDNHGFCSTAATRKFLRWVREYDPDVIWLHNVHGYYIHIGLLFDYLRGCGKKIYWTLHDCWSFTGHCAHFDFVCCDRWKTGCHDCPQKKEYPASLLKDNSRENYEKKERCFTNIPNLTIITPSQWLADLAKQSFLREYPIEVVHNSINLSVFKPSASDFRQRYGLESKKVILGVASVWSERKGLQDFVKLASLVDDGSQIVLVGLTPKQIQNMPENILALTRTNSAKALAEIYTAADVFVNPTYEDTYPTVNLEARACGTRVVCYDTGGSKETLGEGDTLVPKGDIQALLTAVMGGEKL